MDTTRTDQIISWIKSNEDKIRNWYMFKPQSRFQSVVYEGVDRGDTKPTDYDFFNMTLIKGDNLIGISCFGHESYERFDGFDFYDALIRCAKSLFTPND